MNGVCVRDFVVLAILQILGAYYHLFFVFKCDGYNKKGKYLIRENRIDHRIARNALALLYMQWDSLECARTWRVISPEEPRPQIHRVYRSRFHHNGVLHLPPHHQNTSLSVQLPTPCCVQHSSSVCIMGFQATEYAYPSENASDFWFKLSGSVSHVQSSTASSSYAFPAWRIRPTLPLANFFGNGSEAGSRHFCMFFDQVIWLFPSLHLLIFVPNRQGALSGLGELSQAT
jgi:hypothetical protein